jgi:hypothetical protein
MAMYLMASNKQGMSAISLAKPLGCSRPTADHLIQKFRHALSEQDASLPLSGLVEIDETYVGGVTEGPGTQGRSTKTKTPVIAMVERKGDNLSGNICLRPLANVKSPTVMLAMGHTVSPGASIRTDALASYARLPSMGYNHLPEKSLGGAARPCRSSWRTATSPTSRAGCSAPIATTAAPISIATPLSSPGAPIDAIGTTSANPISANKRTSATCSPPWSTGGTGPGTLSTNRLSILARDWQLEPGGP